MGNETGTGVAMLERRGAELDSADQAKIEQFKRAGYLAIAEKKTLAEMDAMIMGCEWGNIRGANMSPATRAAVSKYCVMVRANPITDVDILGGKPYLNANYYHNRVSGDVHFIDDEIINLDLKRAQLLRAQAKAALQEAKDLGLPEPTAEVQEILKVARQIEAARAEWGVPDNALAAYEVRIRRYIPNAPLDDLKNGRVQNPEQYIRVVREANWVTSGRNDPVGKAEPEKTARSRAYRRCGKSAFPTWYDNFEEAIEQAGRAIEAEWHMLEEDQAERRQISAGGNAVATGNGEPTAAVAGRPRPLPVQDLDRGDTNATRPADPAEDDDSQQAGTELLSEADRDRLRKGFMGTLRAAGITQDDRKAWQAEHGLPESTSKWTREDFERARKILEAPTREAIMRYVGDAGCETIAEYCQMNELGGEPATLSGLIALLKHIQES